MDPYVSVSSFSEDHKLAVVVRTVLSDIEENVLTRGTLCNDNKQFFYGVSFFLLYMCDAELVYQWCLIQGAYCEM